MRTTRTRSALAVGLIGARMAVAGPAVADTQSSQSDGWGQPVPLSKALDGTQLQAATVGTLASRRNAAISRRRGSDTSACSG